MRTGLWTTALAVALMTTGTLLGATADTHGMADDHHQHTIAQSASDANRAAGGPEHQPGYLGTVQLPTAQGTSRVVLYGATAPPGVHAWAQASGMQVLEHVDPQPAIDRVADDVASQRHVLSDAEHAAMGPFPPGPNSGIGPGSHILIDRPDGTFRCTANWVFKDTSDNYYLGTAGHCLLYGGVDDSDDPAYDKTKVSVDVCVNLCVGASVPFGSFVTLGPVEYAIQESGGLDIGFDFGIVRIKDSQLGDVRPWLWQWGGPTGQVHPLPRSVMVHYGHGVGVGEVFPTKGRVAPTVTPGTIHSMSAGWVTGGDSGSPLATLGPRAEDGEIADKAAGIITHSIVVVGAPLFWSTTVNQGESLAEGATGLSLDLVLGSDPVP